MTGQLQLPIQALTEFCQRNEIVELALFGSALRDDFRPDSDIDLLVTFAPDARHSLFNMVDMEAELGALLGRKVDLVSKAAVASSRNYIRRKSILESAQTLYAAR